MYPPLMSEFLSLSGPLPHIPDDLTIPQFILDDNIAGRPRRPDNSPWIIHDTTGQSFHLSQISQRTRHLANAFNLKWGIGKGDTVCIFSPNNISRSLEITTNHSYYNAGPGYPICIWATHTLGGIITPANPAYKTDELVHQLRVSKAALLIIHPAFLHTAQAAAKEIGLSTDRIIFIEPPVRKPNSSCITLDDLIKYGGSIPTSYNEIRFRPGEAKTTLAFLSFSSGTTGKPKVREARASMERLPGSEMY
ncbi:hypothetical protein H0H93_014173 [Arthromyces matolae]|nr:hypothetical protein H0H93_014173 [Arthromyces matolae]